jgi:sugar lactone lactonase YvrE
VFLQFSEEDGSPDGMTTDAEGGLWIAHWGASKITRHEASGKVTRTISLPCSQVTSCAFGGPELKTLYITTAAVGLPAERLEQEPLAGGLFAINIDIAGVPPNRFGG